MTWSVEIREKVGAEGRKRRGTNQSRLSGSPGTAASLPSCESHYPTPSTYRDATSVANSREKMRVFSRNKEFASIPKVLLDQQEEGNEAKRKRFQS